MTTEDEEYPKAFEYYEMIKGYANHEDDLLNHRVHWCLLVNSFMFASLAVVVSQSHDLRLLRLFEGWINLPLLHTAIVAIAISGGFVTLVSSLGIRAAARSLEVLARKWRRVRRTRYESVGDMFPDILGGGSKRAHRDGLSYPRLLVRLLLVIWVLVGLGGLLDVVLTN